MSLPLLAALAGAGMIVKGISSVVSANTQAKSADKGAKTVEQYSNRAAGYQQPYYDIGTQNLRTLNNQIASGTYNMAPQTFNEQAFDFQADPGYQFRMQQGTNAVQNSAAARGSGLSGPTMRALQRYGQGFASNEYGNAWNRFNTNRNFAYNNFTDQYNRGAVEQNARYGRQAGIANVGVNSANMLSNIASNTGAQLADIYGQKGNAQAAGQMGVGNAIGEGLNTVGDYMLLSELTGGGRSAPTTTGTQNSINYNPNTFPSYG